MKKEEKVKKNIKKDIIETFVKYKYYSVCWKNLPVVCPNIVTSNPWSFLAHFLCHSKIKCTYYLEMPGTKILDQTASTVSREPFQNLATK